MHFGQTFFNALRLSCSNFAEKNARNYAQRYFRLLVIIFIGAGALLVRNSEACDSIIWANIYRVSDFSNIHAIIEYVKNLRVAIPIIISLTEIASYNIFGNTILVTHILYRIALVLSFVLAISLSKNSCEISSKAWTVYFKTSASFLISAVFLCATIIIHPGNPQSYDIFSPCFSLLYIFLLERALSGPARSGSPKRLALVCIASGFFLSMAELSRPFVFYLLPLLLLFTWQALRALSTKLFYWFLIPVVIFSGGWHSYIYLRHGQLVWSNNGGFNLQKAWPMVEMPELVAEINAKPITIDRLPNINTAEHFENSKRIQHAVLMYMISRPLKTMELIYKRICSLLVHVKTDLYSYKPAGWLLMVYKPVVWLAALWLLINASLLCAGAIKNGPRIFGVPDHILIVMTVAYICFLAIGDAGEEARFLVSVLPLLAVLPGYIKSPRFKNDKRGLPSETRASFRQSQGQL